MSTGKYFRVDDKDYERYHDTLMYGRIREYDSQKGFGWIYTELGKDIFASSYDFTGKGERKAEIGTYVKFRVGRFQEKIVAKEIELISSMQRDESPIVVGEIVIPVKKVKKIISQTGKYAIYYLNLSEVVKCAGYESKLFDNVVIN